MNTKNEKGFTGLLVLLIIVVISLIVFSGWRALTDNTSNDKQLTDSSNNETYRGLKQSYKYQGPGMEPTIGNDQNIYGYLAAPNAVKRGDIIVFKPPITNTDRFVKRVVGLPGDKVSVRDGVLMVKTHDGSDYDPGLSGSSGLQRASKLVEDNSFFVVGDNIGNSLDSLTEAFGLVPFDNMQAIIEL